MFCFFYMTLLITTYNMKLKIELKTAFAYLFVYQLISQYKKYKFKKVYGICEVKTEFFLSTNSLFATYGLIESDRNVLNLRSRYSLQKEIKTLSITFMQYIPIKSLSELKQVVS